MKHEEEILEMINSGKSTYAIHMNTGYPFAEVCAVLRKKEEAKERIRLAKYK